MSFNVIMCVPYFVIRSSLVIIIILDVSLVVCLLIAKIAIDSLFSVIVNNT